MYNCIGWVCWWGVLFGRIDGVCGSKGWFDSRIEKVDYSGGLFGGG